MTPNAYNHKLELVETFRGLAALLVLLHHATGITQGLGTGVFLGGAFFQANVGVNFFFVLSGFIILYAHFDDLGRPARLKRFVAKRFIRIYPIYWVVLAAVLPVYFIVPSFGSGAEREPGVIIRSIFLVPQPTTVLTVSWSLSYEIIFYSLFGLAIGLPRRWWRISLVVAGLALVGLGGLALASGTTDKLIVVASNALEFGLGCLAAWWLRRYRLPAPRLVMWVGAGAFGALELVHSYGWVQLENTTVPYGLLAMVIVVGAASCDLYQPMRVPGLLRGLGAASYAIYLTHYVFLSLFLKLSLWSGIARLGPFWTTLAIIIVTLASGFGVHYLIERPLLRWCRRKVGLERVAARPEVILPASTVGVSK